MEYFFLIEWYSEPSTVQRNITDHRRVSRDLIQNQELLTFTANGSRMNAVLIVSTCFYQQPLYWKDVDCQLTPPQEFANVNIFEVYILLAFQWGNYSQRIFILILSPSFLSFILFFFYLKNFPGTSKYSALYRADAKNYGRVFWITMFEQETVCGSKLKTLGVIVPFKWKQIQRILCVSSTFSSPVERRNLHPHLVLIDHCIVMRLIFYNSICLPVVAF